MKIVAVVSTLDLKYRLGCTPAWWQLIKGLYETENDVVVVPYLGRDIQTPWWESRKNPCRLPGELYYALARQSLPKSPGNAHAAREKMTAILASSVVRPVVRRRLMSLVEREEDIDAVLFMNIPINHIKGLPRGLKDAFGVKTIFYDGDMPTILPENNLTRGFLFDYYRDADISEFDLFVVNSEGVVDTLIRRGARKVHPLHYGADPELFHPVNVQKTTEVGFFGYGSQQREKWMRLMISEPSIRMHARFAVAGGGFGIPLGNALYAGDIPMSGFRRYCCSARINLNITRESHTKVYASSTARPFELAAMGCCVVSCPYNGLENWFGSDKEIVILKDGEDPVSIYESLLDDEGRMREIGDAARSRIIRDHTYRHRAAELVSQISGLR